MDTEDEEGVSDLRINLAASVEDEEGVPDLRRSMN